MASERLTDKFIERLPFATADKAIVYRDEKTPGLLLRVGKRTKTLIFQTESKGKTIYRRLGEWDGEHVKLEDCKKLAQGFKGDLARGKNLAGKRMGVTVKAAFANFIRRRRTSQDIEDPSKVSDDQLLNGGQYDYALTPWAKVVKGFYTRVESAAGILVFPPGPTNLGVFLKDNNFYSCLR